MCKPQSYALVLPWSPLLFLCIPPFPLLFVLLPFLLFFHPQTIFSLSLHRSSSLIIPLRSALLILFLSPPYFPGSLFLLPLPTQPGWPYLSPKPEKPDPALLHALLPSARSIVIRLSQTRTKKWIFFLLLLLFSEMYQFSGCPLWPTQPGTSDDICSLGWSQRLAF